MKLNAAWHSKHPNKPLDERELAVLLGRAHGAFRVVSQRGTGVTSEWRRHGKNSPWVLKVSQENRTLLYATPRPGAFEATVVLGKRAAEAALAGRVSKSLPTGSAAAKTASRST